jgi:hypothetical protein
LELENILQKGVENGDLAVKMGAREVGRGVGHFL